MWTKASLFIGGRGPISKKRLPRALCPASYNLAYLHVFYLSVSMQRDAGPREIASERSQIDLDVSDPEVLHV